MPIEPIVDLSTIDLDAVAISAEEVGRINPQCGDMRQLDHLPLLDVDRGVAVGVKKVTDEEFWVPLHIPGRPLMPGVLMIEGAAQLSSVYHRYRTGNKDNFLGFTRLDETTFRSQVLPGNQLIYLMQEVKFQQRRFITRVQGFVDDQLAFEAKITGMVL